MLLSYEDVMVIRLPATPHRKSISVIRIKIPAPLNTPVDTVRWIHENLPGDPRALDMVQDIMNPQELKQLTEYAIDLVRRRKSN